MPEEEEPEEPEKAEEQGKQAEEQPEEQELDLEQEIEELEAPEELEEKLEEVEEEADEEEAPEKPIPTEEKFFTVPLKEAKKAKKPYRSRAAVKKIKEFLKKHLKREVKISGQLNQEIWKGGGKPPSKIKVKAEMTPDQVKVYPASQ